MTSYKEIFKRFLKKIEDKDLPLFTQEEQNEFLSGLLDEAISYIELDGLKIENNLSDRDSKTQQFNNTLLNCEMEAIAMYMVVAWYEPKINSLEHTLMFVGTSSDKWTSQKDHLEMMQNTRERKRIEARKYFRDYGYKNNSYISEDS